MLVDIAAFQFLPSNFQVRGAKLQEDLQCDPLYAYFEESGHVFSEGDADATANNVAAIIFLKQTIY